MKGFQKIISLLPSATEIIYCLDLEERLKGVTHTCTFPSDALNKPKIITPSFDINKFDSLEIDKKIKQLALDKEQIFILDSIKIKEIQPDLVISQNTCEVCAPFQREIQQISSILGYTPQNLDLSPKNMDEILQSILTIGNQIGNLEKALIKVNELTGRINFIKKTIEEYYKNNKKIQKPRVICLEWLSPFYLAGHWVPEMVEIAGGSNIIGKAGSSSKPITIDTIMNFDPDKIIIIPCGFDLERTSKESVILNNIDEWKSLKAVKADEVYMLDANSYFSKPSPLVIDGIEIVAKIFYPDLFNDLAIPKDAYKKFNIRSYPLIR
ncbi:MAG TPA: ABC transporter substrate-binding protein [Candidatus Nitrosocosmicus sp.]